jgi:hypothetical protein
LGDGDDAGDGDLLKHERQRAQLHEIMREKAEADDA